MALHNDLGNKGEKLSVQYLESLGYTILATNWRFKKLEIDIIAQHVSDLVVIEVKTRQTNYFGDPESFVSKKQQRNLIVAAGKYMETNQLDLEVRFDVISILYNEQEHTLKHIESAFYPIL